MAYKGAVRSEKESLGFFGFSESDIPKMKVLSRENRKGISLHTLNKGKAFRLMKVL